MTLPPVGSLGFSSPLSPWAFCTRSSGDERAFYFLRVHVRGARSRRVGFGPNMNSDRLSFLIYVLAVAVILLFVIREVVRI